MMSLVRYLDEHGWERTEPLESFSKKYGGFNDPRLREKGIKIVEVRLADVMKSRARIEEEKKFEQRFEDLMERVSRARASIEKSGQDSSWFDEKIWWYVEPVYRKILRGELPGVIVRSDALDSGRIDAIAAIRFLKSVYSMRGVDSTGKLEKAVSLALQNIENLVSEAGGR